MSAFDVFGYGIDLLAVLLLALGLKGLSKVRSARSANGLAALAMGLAVAGLLIQLQPSATAWLWIAVGTTAGGVLGLLTAQRVPMTAMPETVALFNGCGGMASLLVALAVALFDPSDSGLVERISIVISVFVGAITFSGSIVAMGKLQGWIGTPGWTQSSVRHAVNITLALASLVGGVFMASATPVAGLAAGPLWLLVVASTLLGIGVTLPIGGADMPVVISLLNSYSGVAAAAAGFVVGSQLLIVAGAMVGVAVTWAAVVMRPVTPASSVAALRSAPWPWRRRSGWCLCPATAWRWPRPNTPCASWPSCWRPMAPR
jgi:NAD(P) transhydrogenase subunit beta